jgi:hypothetical protein
MKIIKRPRGLFNDRASKGPGYLAYPSLALTIKHGAATLGAFLRPAATIIELT